MGSAVLLAKALGVTLSALLEEDSEHGEVVIKKDTRDTHTTPEGVYTRLSNASRNTHLEVVRMELDPSTETPDHKTHPGEEWVYVLEGSVKLELGTTVYVLNTGDAAHYLAEAPHRFTALDTPAEIILSISSGRPYFH